MTEPTPSAGTERASGAPPRVVAVDVLRGATMALMIVVNNPGSWNHMLAPLRHAAWGSWLTPADFVFPFFLFLVGVSTVLGLRRRVLEGQPARGVLARGVRRAAILFAIGLFLNLFPHFDPQTLRVMGVLQRIAIVYLGCAAAFLFLSPKSIAALALLLLVGYGLVLSWVPVPGVGAPVLTPETSLPVWLDERLLAGHTWRGPGDPEGVLSTLGALATGLMGVSTGFVLLSRRDRAGRPALLGGAGGAVLGLGLLVSLFLPAVKEVWTPSYALITTGAALLALAGLDRVEEGSRVGRLGRPAARLGRHALTAYVLAHLFSDLSIHVVRLPDPGGGTRSLHSWIHDRALASWLPGDLASLVYSLIVLALVWFAVEAWSRRQARAARA